MKKILFIIIFIFFYYIPTNLHADVKPISEGSREAKIKIIVFESLTCSHCADFHKNIYPNLKKEFIDKGHVFIEFKNFPLDMAAFNASKIAHCKNDGKSEILHYLFKNQSQWIKGNNIADLNKNLKKLIEKANFNLNFDECLNNSKIEDFILEDRINGSKKFKIEATPTIIINNEKFENASNYKKLKKYLEKLI
tara:strand:- start:3 stop:584 length:582 start_codon:yes stop_codon:yes gene_type:complete